MARFLVGLVGWGRAQIGRRRRLGQPPWTPEVRNRTCRRYARASGSGYWGRGCRRPRPARLSARQQSATGGPMTTAVLETKTHAFDVEDVEYLRHGDKPLLARVFKPRGEGPFPAMVECHGGAWCQSDRFTEKLRHEAMASQGIVSIALDFRSGDADPYPASVQDINYAVRWAKH